MSADLYGDLGVSRAADLKEIKQAYRKLAKQFHPDKNPGDKVAEERFKRVASAFGVLGDKDKRSLYDEFGEQSLTIGFDPHVARAMAREARAAQVWTGVEAYFWNLSGQVHQPQPPPPSRRPGQHVAELIEVPFLTALRGGRVERPDGFVKIPRGTGDGNVLRVNGRGKPGNPPGDLILTVIVPPHPFLRVVPAAQPQVPAKHWPHLEMHGVQVTWLEIYQHGFVHIPTPWGAWPLEVDPTSPEGKLDGVESVTIPGYGFRCPCVGPCNCVHGDIKIFLVPKAPPPGDPGLQPCLQRLQGLDDPRAELARSLA